MSEILRIDMKTVNAYLIKTGNRFVLVDTGGYGFRDRPLSNKREILLPELEKNGCVPGTLDLVFLTHGDIDHVANCRYLQETYGAKIAVHKNDEALTHDLTVEKIFSNFKFRSIGFKIVSFLMNPLFVKITKKIIAEYEGFTPDILFDDEFDPADYGLDAKLLPLPGHSKGSVGLLFSDGSLICGDVLANLEKPGISMNHWDLKALMKSVESLKKETVTMVYPGHGEPFQFAELK